MSRRDYRDDVITELADSETAIREALAERDADRDAMRLVASQAIHQIHDLQIALETLRQQHHRALDDARRLRGQIAAADERETVST